jgi:hypothetical protein
MKLSFSRRELAVVLGAIATAAAVFAPAATAKPAEVRLTIPCSALQEGAGGAVEVFDNGVAKGHCFFQGSFPNLGLGVPASPHDAEFVSCARLAAVLAPSLHITIISAPTGDAVLTPSHIANVNCRNVFFVRNPV